MELLDHGRPVASGPEAISRAAARLRDGEVVAIPTDTVYGLAAALDHPGALTGIFHVKGRPADKSLPILVDDVASIASLLPDGITTETGTRRLVELAARFWPGGLTIALPASSTLDPAVLAADGTAGFRVPDDAVARDLIRAAGGAIAVTSANRSGEPTPADPGTIAAQLGAGPTPLRWVLAAGKRPGNHPSTVIGLRGVAIVVHRAGVIDPATITDEWSRLGEPAGRPD